MGKKVRVFLGKNELAHLNDRNNCKPSDQNCFFCDLLNCQYVQKDGSKVRLGLVRLFGKDISVIYSPLEGCWLPYSA